MKGMPLVIFWAMIVSFGAIKTEILMGLSHQNSENECSKVANDVTEANKKTRVLDSSAIIGKWVSERCESRLGAQFVLRSYTFHANGTFRLVRFYLDESCSSVSYTLTVDGCYERQDPVRASGLVYGVRRVTVVAHDIRTASDLFNAVDGRCPDVAHRYWKPFVEYVVVEMNGHRPTQPASSQSTSNYELQSEVKYIDSAETNERCWQKLKNNDPCFKAINLSLAELKEVRIQSRYTLENQSKYELLLANMNAFTDQHCQVLHHRFQLPLILVNGTSNCLICDVVGSSTNMFVQQHLPAKPQLPLNVNGEWISERCEVQSTGLLSMRTLILHQLSRKWQLKTSYYSDNTCSNLVMVHRAFGFYFENGVLSKEVPGAVNVNFTVEKSYLTVFDETKLQAIRKDPCCGIPNYWELRVTSEIPCGSGCASLGILYRSTSYEIARLETDDHGTFLLYLGDEGSIGGGDRPTAYKYPLLRCSSHVDEEQLSHLSDMSWMLQLSSSMFLFIPMFHHLAITLR